MLQNFIELPDDIKYSVMLKWLNENVVKRISYENNEPARMTDHRLQSLKIFNEKPMPTWGPDLSRLNFDEIVFFAKPESIIDNADKREQVPTEIKEKFEKLGIPEAERKYLAGAGWQFDSSSFYHKIKEKREKLWIIFEDMNLALHNHENIVKKYFMKLVPPTDHKFAALHGAVWSWWTFIYIPQWVKLTEPLQTYFRMNIMFGWQFEHTLIILENDTQWAYIEWCSAPKYWEFSLHAGCVELFIGKNSNMRYSSVENWSSDTYNLNTKRAILKENAYIEWVSGNFGSNVSMLYPMSILKWDNSKADHLWVAMAGKWQIQDIGSKVLHIGKNTSSNIVSKSICKDWWENTYRGLVSIAEKATGSVNSTKCDAILIDWDSFSDTIPKIEMKNTSSILSHEASAGKIDEDILFYINSRGLNENTATALIVNWFVNPIIKKLPLEYSGELNKLIELELS